MIEILYYIAVFTALALQVYLTVGFYYTVVQTDDKTPQEYLKHSLKLFFGWPWMKNK